jgi:TRAP-type mannitol/chloroaromatic compound transport system substrate-binding protein
LGIWKKYEINNTPKDLQKALKEAFDIADKDTVAKEYCQKFIAQLKKWKKQYIKLQKKCGILNDI